MGWTKQQIINQAFEAVGIAAYTFDLSSEQLQSALRQLDMMMAAWNARGIRLGYPIPANVNGGSLTDQSGLSDMAIEAVYTNLAIRLCPGVGKTASPELKTLAKHSLDALFSLAATPPEMQFPSGTPAGAGNRRWTENPFLDEPSDLVDAGPDGELEVQ